jgi:hypothetical protein
MIRLASGGLARCNIADRPRQAAEIAITPQAESDHAAMSTDHLLYELDHFAVLMAWLGVAITLSVLSAVVIARVIMAYWLAQQRRLERQYGPVAQRALHGDHDALQILSTSPVRLRPRIVRLLLLPLYERTNLDRIDRIRTIFHAMSLVEVANRLLRSRLWWRRTLALRALGILQMRSHTSAIIAALDDRSAEVRATALDALTDLRNPASLPAVIGRLNDESLQQGRRLAAVAAFGSDAEPLLLKAARADEPNRVNYARALGLCGTRRALPALCEWTQDPDSQVRVAALDAMGHVGLDDHAATVVIASLESDDVDVRATAAHTLRNWTGAAEAATYLTRHLDDSWPVAVRAAQTLRTLGDAGTAALQESAERTDLAGQLARHMLWQPAGS